MKQEYFYKIPITVEVTGKELDIIAKYMEESRYDSLEELVDFFLHNIAGVFCDDYDKETARAYMDNIKAPS